MSTLASPPASCSSLAVPLTGAVKDEGEPPGADCAAAPDDGCASAVLEALASKYDGVPARFAHPGASGPLGSQTSSARGPIVERAIAVTRAPRWPGHPAAARATTATTMTATQTPASVNIHVVLVSLPVPRPCNSATGQLTYASQCGARQAR